MTSKQNELMETVTLQKYFHMSTDDLLTKGVEKYFLREELHNSYIGNQKEEEEEEKQKQSEDFSNSLTYRQWFEVMATRLTRTAPFVFEKFVLMKIKCKSPKQEYAFFTFKKKIDKKFFLFSEEENKYYEQHTNLKILTKGWRHDTTTVLILHPDHALRSIKMIEGGMEDHYCGWYVDYIPQECIYNKDGFFIVICLKDESKNIYQQIYS